MKNQGRVLPKDYQEFENSVASTQSKIQSPLPQSSSVSTPKPVETFPKHSTLTFNDKISAKNLGIKSLHIKGWLQKLPDDVQRIITSLFHELVTSEYNSRKGCHITIDAPYNRNHSPNNESRKVHRHYSSKNEGPIDVDGNVHRAAYGGGSGRQTVGILEEYVLLIP